MKQHYTILLTFLLLSVISFAQHQETEKEKYLQEANQRFEALSFDSALFYYQKAYFLDTLDVKSIRGIAKSLQKKGQPQFSKRYYQKILHIKDHDIGALYALANLYRKERQYTESLSYFQKLHNMDTTNAFYYKKMALLYQDLKNDSLAILNYQKCLDFNAEDMQSAHALAKIYYHHKKYKLANQTLRPYIHFQYVENTLIRLYISTLYQLNYYEEVIKYGENLLQKNDSNVALIKSIGLSHFQLKDYQSSLKTFSFIPDEQKNSGTYYYMGLCANELGKSEEAIDYFNQAITDVYPNNYHQYFVHLAFALEDLKAFESAIQQLRLGYKITQHSSLIFHLARIYDEFYKDKGVALKHYQKYLRSTPDNSLFIKFSKERIKVLKPIVFFENND